MPSPEYSHRMHVPLEDTDVFSFGALLLEVTCGRRPVEPNAYPAEFILIEWVLEKWREGNIFQVVDEKLNGEFDEAEVVLVLKLGLLCSNSDPALRPSIRQVVRCLEGEVDVSEVLNAPVEYQTAELADKSDITPSSFPSYYYSSARGFGDGDARVDFSSGSPMSLLYGSSDSREYQKSQ